jgi:hypothetical protein
MSSEVAALGVGVRDDDEEVDIGVIVEAVRLLAGRAEAQDRDDTRIAADCGGESV